MLVKVQSTLNQLQDQEVRAALVGGKIVKTDGPAMILVCLDVIRELLNPEWSPSEAILESAAAVSAFHWEFLYKEGDHVFKLPHPTILLEEYSYATWMKAIQKFQNSKYWLQRTVSPKTVVTSQKPKAREEAVFISALDTSFSSDELSRAIKQEKK